jgi:hypothetical protein
MVSGQQHAPAALYPRVRPGTNCTGGWVGPRGRSGRVENLVPTGNGSRAVQPVAQSLYRLSYPAHNLSQYTLYLLSVQYICYKILYMHLSCPIRATCPAHIIHLITNW